MRTALDRVRVVLRTLRKQPVFTAVVVLSLGLAIALDSSAYGVLDALVHPRTDIRDPERLFWLQYYGNYRIATNPERDAAVRDGVHTIAQSAYLVPWARRGLMEHGATAAETSIAAVGPNFFDLLGGRLAAGRTFVAGDRYATPTPIVISERLATELMPAGGTVLGERVRLGDSTYTVIGVTSKYTTFPDFPLDAFMLAAPPPTGIYVRIIRLRPDATAEQTNVQLDLVAQRLAAAGGLPARDVGLRMHPIYDAEYHYQGFHIALMLSVAAVLLVACANVANMQLARGIGRRRELALRAALGASRGRIVGHLLTESVVLAGAGLALGLLLTAWATVGLHAIIPPSVGKLIVEPQWNWRVLASAVVATAGCILIVGVAPAVAVSRIDPNELLKSGAGTGATRAHRRTYGHLVAAEVALALFLLSGASALVRARLRLAGFAKGFDTAPLATAAWPPAARAGTRVAVADLLADAVQHARAVPGVANAAAVTSRPVLGDSVTIADSASGQRAVPAPLYSAAIVTPGYLRTMGLPIVRGRDFLEGERDVQAAIVDDFTAMSLWPNADPIGALIKMGAPHSAAPFVRVIGVFGYRGTEMQHRYEIAELNGTHVGRVLMLPDPADSTTVVAANRRVDVTVRAASGDATRLPVALRRAGFSWAFTMDDAMAVTSTRVTLAFIAKVFGAFAVLGVGLAAFGVYGVVAHSVAERRRELGVRIALGAGARDILHAVLRETVVIGLAGIAIGLLATKYGVQALGTFAMDEIYDAPLFAAAAAFLLVVAAAAALLPAWRATRVDPTEALRSE